MEENNIFHHAHGQRNHTRGDDVDRAAYSWSLDTSWNDMQTVGVILLVSTAVIILFVLVLAAKCRRQRLASSLQRRHEQQPSKSQPGGGPDRKNESLGPTTTTTTCSNADIGKKPHDNDDSTTSTSVASTAADEASLPNKEKKKKKKKKTRTNATVTNNGVAAEHQQGHDVAMLMDTQQQVLHLSSSLSQLFCCSADERPGHFGLLDVIPETDSSVDYSRATDDDNEHMGAVSLRSQPFPQVGAARTSNNPIIRRGADATSLYRRQVAAIDKMNPNGSFRGKITSRPLGLVCSPTTVVPALLDPTLPCPNTSLHDSSTTLAFPCGFPDDEEQPQQDSAGDAVRFFVDYHCPEDDDEEAVYYKDNMMDNVFVNLSTNRTAAARAVHRSGAVVAPTTKTQQRDDVDDDDNRHQPRPKDLARNRRWLPISSKTHNRNHRLLPTSSNQNDIHDCNKNSKENSSQEASTSQSSSSSSSSSSSTVSALPTYTKSWNFSSSDAFRGDGNDTDDDGSSLSMLTTPSTGTTVSQCLLQLTRRTPAATTTTTTTTADAVSESLWQFIDSFMEMDNHDDGDNDKGTPSSTPPPKKYLGRVGRDDSGDAVQEMTIIGVVDKQRSDSHMKKKNSITCHNDHKVGRASSPASSSTTTTTRRAIFQQWPPRRTSDRSMGTSKASPTTMSVGRKRLPSF
jgi:hypothetical protein